MIFKQSRAILTAALIATTALAATPAAAQIPVIDPTAIARIREVVSTGAQQLTQIRQQVQQVTQMRNTIGQLGQGQLSSILSSSGINLSGPESLLRDVNTLGSSVGNMQNVASNFSISGENLRLPQIQTIQDGREAASQLFFYGGNSTMSMTEVQQLRERRNAVLRETAITAHGAATAIKSDLTQTQQIADRLSAQAAAATDLRTDVQANTATMLAIYTEVQKQTALQAQLLELTAAQTLSTDATGRRNAGGK